MVLSFSKVISDIPTHIFEHFKVRR